jgi:hypothetical protein
MLSRSAGLNHIVGTLVIAKIKIMTISTVKDVWEIFLRKEGWVTCMKVLKSA